MPTSSIPSFDDSFPFSNDAARNSSENLLDTVESIDGMSSLEILALFNQKFQNFNSAEIERNSDSVENDAEVRQPNSTQPSYIPTIPFSFQSESQPHDENTFNLSLEEQQQNLRHLVNMMHENEARKIQQNAPQQQQIPQVQSSSTSQMIDQQQRHNCLQAPPYATQNMYMLNQQVFHPQNSIFIMNNNDHTAGVWHSPPMQHQFPQQPRPATTTTMQAPVLKSPTYFLREAFKNNVTIQSPTPMQGQGGCHMFSQGDFQSPSNSNPLNFDNSTHSMLKATKMEPAPMGSSSAQSYQSKSAPKKLTINTSAPSSSTQIPHAFGQHIHPNMFNNTNPYGIQPSRRPMTAPSGAIINFSPYLSQQPQLQFDQSPFFQKQRLTKPQKQAKQCKMKTKKATTGKGLWSDEEHQKFLEGLERFGRSKWKEIAEYIGTRTRSQVSSHSQKYFKKIESMEQNE